MLRHSITIAAALAVSLLAASPVLARQPTQTVHYADLDLSTEAGARAVLARIDAAARYVCWDHDGQLSISERRLVRQCLEDVTHQTVARLDHPTVTAMYVNEVPAQMAQR